jgi:glutamate dehydrogenase
VFGNGMLLSKEIKLVAAFDHRDIFIDPAPDPSVSWEERRRLFELPRSSWKDYDRNKLSEGGGIYSRTEKYIAPSGPAQALLGVGPLVTPNELIAAIIKAPLDLLWFGGIGTYVRGSGETDADAGDKANDAVRATANHLRARVVGEGANLAVTQRGRIEYAARGGRINTDAIDNSAGVNTSDVEVNIKIALGTAMAAGKLDLPGRNAQLKAMTDAVAAMVLRNNYLQTLALSLAEREGLGDLGFQRRLMQSLEAKGLLDRQVEALPSDAAMVERFQASAPLTRPELAMLLAYAKMDLENLLTHSSIPDDPYFGRALLRYFPALMRERFSAEIERHPLRREIVATGLANEIVNRGGPTFVVRLVDETGHAPEDVAYAFAAVMSVYDVAAVCADIDALDGVVDGVKQLDLYRKVQDLLRRQTAWFLLHGLSEVSLGEEIERYREGVSFIGGNLDAILPEPARQGVARERQALEAIGVPKELAAHLSTLDPLSQALDAILVANASKVPLDLSARTIFAIRDWFRLDALAAAGEALANGDYFERLAINSSIAAASATQRAIARAVFLNGTAAGGFEAWKESNKAAADRVAETIRSITEGRSFSLA